MSQVAWAWCDPVLADPPIVDLRRFPLNGVVGSDGLSLFGGVSLSSNPQEAEVVMGRIGIVSVPTTFVSSPNLVPSLDFCKNDVYVGSMDFDETGFATGVVSHSTPSLRRPCISACAAHRSAGSSSMARRPDGLAAR
jgi:hypothetical protein